MVSFGKDSAKSDPIVGIFILGCKAAGSFQRRGDFIENNINVDNLADIKREK